MWGLLSGEASWVWCPLCPARPSSGSKRRGRRPRPMRNCSATACGIGEGVNSLQFGALSTGSSTFVVSRQPGRLRLGNAAEDFVLLLTVFPCFWELTMISAGSEAAAAGTAEPRPAPSDRGLQLRGADDSWRSAAAKSTCSRDGCTRCQARTQAPGTEAWRLLLFDNGIVVFVISGQDKALCACDGRVTEKKDWQGWTW